jgi:hypothetical protein
MEYPAAWVAAQPALTAAKPVRGPGELSLFSSVWIAALSFTGLCLKAEGLLRFNVTEPADVRGGRKLGRHFVWKGGDPDNRSRRFG